MLHAAPCGAAQICACLHSTTATEEKHAPTTQGQSRISYSLPPHLAPLPTSSLVQKKRLYLLKNVSSCSFTIWMDCAGTVGLNSSSTATGFTHDFPVRAVSRPVSWSHRCDARNTKITADTETNLGSICLFPVIPVEQRRLKWQVRALCLG